MTDTRRRPGRLGLSLLGVVGLLLAVQLLAAAATAAGPALRPLVVRYAGTGPQALGASWLLAYGLMNGSAVAAVALSLHAAGLVTPTGLFLMLAGSRLGAAAVVVLVGAVDFAQGRRGSFRESTGLGLLTFVVSHAVYLPATALGLVGLGWLPVGVVPVPGVGRPRAATVAPAVDEAVRALGPGPALVVAVGLLLASLRGIDRSIAAIGTDHLRGWVARLLRTRWRAVGVGLGLTAATTSVAFSVGVLVPLYNRGYVTREEAVAYLLGASVGTLADTAVVAVALGSATGLAVVLVLAGAAGLVTVGLLLGAPGAFARLAGALLDRVVADRWRFVAVLASLVAVPVGLVLYPL